MVKEKKHSGSKALLIFVHQLFKTHYLNLNLQSKRAIKEPNSNPDK